MKCIRTIIDRSGYDAVNENDSFLIKNFVFKFRVWVNFDRKNYLSNKILPDIKLKLSKFYYEYQISSEKIKNKIKLVEVKSIDAAHICL